jgi:3-hydroxyisobutyrate dehydrogenase-like beta-hydroxyacid dehydrogenase
MTDRSVTPRPIATIGFIGLGVMGEPMCGHLARRGGKPVLAYDRRPEPAARLAEAGVTVADPGEIARHCDLILLSLPDGAAVDAVLTQLEPHLQAGQCVADTSTSPAAMTRAIGLRLAGKGVAFADAASWWARPRRCSRIWRRCCTPWAPT